LYSGIREIPSKYVPVRKDRLIDDYTGYVKKKVLESLEQNPE